MALQLGALRDALRQAGASDELAREAVEEVAAYENRLGGIAQQIAGLRTDLEQQIAGLRTDLEQQIAGLRTDLEQQIAGLRAEMDRRFADLRTEMDRRFGAVDQRFTAIEGRLNLLGWMAGTLSAVQIALLLRLLFVH